jgi:hypothetical protein
MPPNARRREGLGFQGDRPSVRVIEVMAEFFFANAPAL